MATLIPPLAIAASPYAYAAAPTHCFLCSYDAIYDYDVSGCFRSRTSSTSVTTTLSGASDFTANEACFPDPAGGHEWDTAGFGMSDYGYRFYKPELGRWINRDPIEERGGLNVYVFLHNEPLASSDLHGLRRWRRCPEGQVWKQKENGEIPDPDGCSVPPEIAPALPGNPNDPTGNCSFEYACNQHDLDYSDCDKSRASADWDFYRAMVSACMECDLSFTQRFSCLWFAARYYEAVVVFGGGPYRNRQEKNCECACP